MRMFNRVKDLKNSLENILYEALWDIGNQVRDELKNNLMNEWYNRPEYKDEGRYQRTYQLYDSITAKLTQQKNGKSKVEVFYDLDKIEAMQTSGFFNAHMSLDYSDSYAGKPIAYWLVLWIENGVQPRYDGTYIGNQPIQGKHILQMTAKWLENNIDKIVIKVFKRYGLTLYKLN